MLSDAIGDVPYIGDPVEVGRGGFATVYRATDLQAGRLVAVKLLSLRADDGNLKHFDRERESLARLSTHPNVVTLHRTGITTDGVPYLVMEFASGGSLTDRLRAEGPMDWSEAIDWILPICDAVEHAHQQGIRHRDIKPQNILVSAHGEPLLSDFGIAGLSAGPETVTQQAKLSLSYASPEQIEGRELDDSSDVYSIGATLYALITGAPAFADTTGAGFLNTAKRIVEERAPTLEPPVPSDVSAAVAAALAKNPAARPTIQELRRALAREVALEAPPADDALPAITQEIAEPVRSSARQAVPATILAPVVDEATVTTAPTEVVSQADDDGGFGAALAAWSRRWLMTAALALLVAIGLITAAWTQLGADDPAEGDQIAAGVADADSPLPPSVSGSSGTTPSGPARSDNDDGDGNQDEVDEAATPTSSPPTTSPPTTRPDADDDGVLDADDNCRDVANRDQSNRDGDALGDACDPDDDGDGSPDEADNCPLLANADQADVDADGLGDSCDDFPDRDGDGIIDSNDPCIEQPDDPDTDGDGTPDQCDPSPRGMAVVAASARIDRVSILNQAYGDGEADMFGDLTIAGAKFGLPEISDAREIRPGNWASDRVEVDPGEAFVRVRIWIRDEDPCFLCRDGLVDVTPEPGMNALHLVIDTSTGAVDLATDSWNRVATIGALTGTDDGDLSGTITQQGDDDGVHLASMDVSITLVRQPAP